MKFFVTGASGQLGSALVKFLVTQGHEVVAYLRHSSSDARLQGQPITIARGALLDHFGLKKWMKGCDGVFHVAGLISWARRDRDKLFRSNVDSTKAVIEMAKESKIPRVVVTSSVFAIGLPNQGTAVDETFAYNGASSGIDYSTSKHCAQEAALAHADNGLEVVVVNPGVIIGPRSRLLRAVQTGMLPFAFPGGMSCVALDDAVTGHWLAFSRGRSGQRYILGGENLSYRRMFEQAAHYFAKCAPARPLPAFLLQGIAFVAETWSELARKAPPQMPHALAKAVSGHHYYSSKKAEEELGWRFRSFAETLKTAFPS